MQEICSSNPPVVTGICEPTLPTLQGETFAGRNFREGKNVKFLGFIL